MKTVRSLVLAAGFIAAPLQAQIITGHATAIDGRTLDLGGSLLLLAHVDAPEASQTCQKDGAAWACGTESTENLAAIIDTKPISCLIVGSDAGGMPIATCETAVFDLGREMVRRGMALALEGAPEEYGAATAIARDLKFGLWAAQFQPPAEWRAANPKAVRRIARVETRPPSGRTASAGPASQRRYTNALGCAIKGNRSRRGEWIYHLPGQMYYEDTRPEDLFCTESQAQAAGYRRSKE